MFFSFSFPIVFQSRQEHFFPSRELTRPKEFTFETEIRSRLRMQTQETVSQRQPHKEISDKIKSSKRRELRSTTESAVNASQKQTKTVSRDVQLHVGSRGVIQSKRENTTNQHTEHLTTTHTQNHVVHSNDNKIPKECSTASKTVRKG